MIHVGDIHSGKDFCTEAYDNQIAALWQQYQKPLVYTPGDNEWADCRKATSLAKPGEGGGFYSSGVLNYIGTSGLTTDLAACADYHCGNPLDNLALIRQLFFAQPGHTLGSGTLNVLSQATAYDPGHPADSNDAPRSACAAPSAPPAATSASSSSPNHCSCPRSAGSAAHCSASPSPPATPPTSTGPQSSRCGPPPAACSPP